MGGVLPPLQNKESGCELERNIVSKRIWGGDIPSVAPRYPSLARAKRAGLWGGEGGGYAPPFPPPSTLVSRGAGGGEVLLVLRTKRVFVRNQGVRHHN